MKEHSDSINTGPSGEKSLTIRQRVGILAAPMVFIFMLLLPAPADLSVAGWRTATIGILMAMLWITEAIPIPATSLLPLVLLPFFGIQKITVAAAPYANPLIFLFMGGFIIALAMQRWHLHRRIALNIIKMIGMKPKSIIFGFMIATAFLSMWVSNTATTMMMLPIAFSVIELAKSSKIRDEDSKDYQNFAVVLMLTIAYASSIGGLATLIGTPPNALLAAFMRSNYHYQIGFAQWMLVGVPLVVIGLPLSIFLLIRILFPIRIAQIEGGQAFIRAELEKLGAISTAEKMVAIVFGTVALLWIFRPLVAHLIPGIDDAGIAILGAMLMFALPVNLRKGEFLLDWHSAEKLPWGVLLLFGGGLSLAGAISETGLSEWIGQQLSAVQNWPIVFVVLIVTAIVIFLTELTSNTATAAAFLPIMASVAVSIGQNPLLLVIPAGVAASCAFMLPVATPPNAIVYGSGQIEMGQMVRGGILLNLLFILLITLVTFSLVSLVFQVEVGVLPSWAQ